MISPVPAMLLPLSDPSLPALRFGIAEEQLLPLPLGDVAFANEGREDGEVQDQPVEEIGREAERLDEVDEEDDPHLVAMVPGLVLVGVVEDQRLALLPMADAIGDADGDLV